MEQSNSKMIVFPEYSKREIREASKVLAETGLQPDDRTLEAFRVAQNVRASYSHPLWHVRRELVGAVGAGVPVASRLKRMSSIRKKLRDTDLNLYQMQDVGGVRAIFETQSDLNRVLDFYLDGQTRHRVHRVYDYAREAKASGYRSVHVVLKYQGTEKMQGRFDRQFLEIQLRTIAQHNWSTAVEAVGLFNDEDLKGGSGSESWLALFSMMSRFIASQEGIGQWSDTDRAALSSASSKIGAVKHLEAYSIGVGEVEYSRTGGRFMIQFDPNARAVSVRKYVNDAALIEQYNIQETERRGMNTVIVNVERYYDLQLSYPNYFLDVRSFLKLLKRACSVAPIEQRPALIVDPKLSWLHEFNAWRKRK